MSWVRSRWAVAVALGRGWVRVFQIVCAVVVLGAVVGAFVTASSGVGVLTLLLAFWMLVALYTDMDRDFWRNDARQERAAVEKLIEEKMKAGK